MGVNIPKSLGFVRSSLYDGEVERWLSWYNNLANPDKRNVGRFLRRSHGWMADEAEDLRQRREQLQKGRKQNTDDPFADEFLKGDYFIVGAIGSTLKGTQYQDVDLLVVTNRIWRDMGSFEGELLEQRLSGDFDYKIDPTVSQAYDQFWGRPNRTLVTLNPKQGSEKSIHITVQPEIRHERYWRENDKESSVILYRMGDVTGYHDTMEAFTEGMQAMDQLLKMAEAQKTEAKK